LVNHVRRYATSTVYCKSSKSFDEKTEIDELDLNSDVFFSFERKI